MPKKKKEIKMTDEKVAVAEKKTKKGMPMLKMSVSGSYKTQPASDKDRKQFSDIEGVTPFADHDYYITFAQRIFPVWRDKDEKLKDINYEGLIKIYVDDVEEIEGTPLCLHKNIKKMTWEELQSLACYKKLREIPLYKKGDIRMAREVAYEQYERQVNGKKVLKSTNDLKNFREKLEQKEMTPEEIEVRLSKTFNMTKDSLDPSKSYDFAKLPALYVDGQE
jgi:hypothetical protein